MFEKGYIWNPATCSCENDKYAGSIIDDSVVVCNEIIARQKSFQQKVLQQNVLQQTSTFY